MLKSYEEMRKVNVSKYVEKRDGIEYLNWAKCIDLLYQNGAEKAFFVPVTGENGSSLIMSSQEFEDKNGIKNRCYEVAVEIHIDDKIYRMQHPVMNGSNPVKDNSMSQQRVWNAQTRAFVKGVAIYTGLGFDLWMKADESQGGEDDLSKHDILKIKERMEILLTQKMNSGMSLDDIANAVGKNSGDELKAELYHYITLYHLENRIRKVGASND